MSVKLPTFFKDSEFLIHITHIPTNSKVEFHSWLTGFSDAFTSTWSPTPAYGRMDDLYTFQKTGRVITISFDTVAADLIEAQLNQGRLNKLTQFLYPVYSNPVAGGSSRQNSQVLQAAPLLRMKFNSLVTNSENNTELVGFLNGYTHSPRIEDGQFFADKGKRKDIVYQSHNVQLTFTVLHTHLTGWVQTEGGQGEDDKVVYSFGKARQTNLDVNYPHGGALTAITQAPDLNNDGVADIWQTQISTNQAEANAAQDEITKSTDETQ
tara:strand:- start:1061 stop:1858 length:798 start_codon:yes stop_codon:yes gene_type:complete